MPLLLANQTSDISSREERTILAKCVIHYDHMGDVVEEAFNAEFVAAGTDTEQVEGRKLIDHMRSAFAAYDAVLVCEDCNNADTAAKKVLAVPREFSFSISQIRGFIQVKNHQPHSINFQAPRMLGRLPSQRSYCVRESSKQ
jgi:hypothetical protein